MPKHYKKNTESQKKIIKERITELFNQAGSVFKENPQLSDKYVKLARRLAMKCRFSIPKELKRRFCKNCYRYLVPGVNCRVRLQKGKRVVYCLGCKKYVRMPYKK